MTQLYLGIDGGQSHTQAIIADAQGRILGTGRGGPSNHAEQPGGRERLARAVTESTNAALHAAGYTADLRQVTFAAAYCAMSGGAEYKTEIIAKLLSTGHLTITHDTLGAWAGAFGGKAGIIVIAGTGSVAYGADGCGAEARAGGLGYLFSDEGSGYWLAAQAVRHVLHAQDGYGPATALRAALLDYFGCQELRELTVAVYAGTVSRDTLASFAVRVHEVAQAGDAVALDLVDKGSAMLAQMAHAVARRLGLDKPLVAGVGGVWRGALMRDKFAAQLAALQPAAQIVAPRFGPAHGALLLAWQSAGILLTDKVLDDWQRDYLTSV